MRFPYVNLSSIITPKNLHLLTFLRDVLSNTMLRFDGLLCRFLLLNIMKLHLDKLIERRLALNQSHILINSLLTVS